jgi:hypothetical protein
MHDYVIAIPSYKRAKTVKLRTLATLKKYKIPEKIIYIFVANKKEQKEYYSVLDTKYHKNIIVGKLGIKNIRMFMSNFFKEGQKICYIDDDVYGIEEAVFNSKSKKKLKEKLKKKKLQETPENIKQWKKSCQVFVPLQSLDTFLTEGFTILKKSKHKLFGINPVHNPFFCTIKDKENKHISYNLKFIVGTLCGVINSRVSEIRKIEQKEDYERTIKYFLETGGVVRFNNISLKTKYYKEPGGLQAIGLRSWEKEHKSAKYLLKTYPELCFTNVKKNKDPKTGKPWPEVILKDKRKKK